MTFVGETMQRFHDLFWRICKSFHEFVWRICKNLHDFWREYAKSFHEITEGHWRDCHGIHHLRRLCKVVMTLFWKIMQAWS